MRRCLKFTGGETTGLAVNSTRSDSKDNFRIWQWIGWAEGMMNLLAWESGWGSKVCITSRGVEEEMGREGTSCFDMYLRCLGDIKAEMLGCIYGSDPGIWM